MVRYIRAFFKTIQLMLRGETVQPPQDRYPKLTLWIDEGLRRLDNALKTAEKNGMSEDVRQETTVKIRKRPMSMDVILKATRHNLTLEYPLLIKRQIEHNVTTLYALNMDDQYRVSTLAASEQLPAPVQQAVQALADHLQAIPPSTDLGD